MREVLALQRCKRLRCAGVRRISGLRTARHDTTASVNNPGPFAANRYSRDSSFHPPILRTNANDSTEIYRNLVLFSSSEWMVRSAEAPFHGWRQIPSHKRCHSADTQSSRSYLGPQNLWPDPPNPCSGQQNPTPSGGYHSGPLLLWWLVITGGDDLSLPLQGRAEQFARPLPELRALVSARKTLNAKTRKTATCTTWCTWRVT